MLMTLLIMRNAVDDLHDVAGDPSEQRENQKVTNKKLKQIIAFPESLVAFVDDDSHMCEPAYGCVWDPPTPGRNPTPPTANLL